MLTDKFLEESGDDVSNDFTTLETLLLIWMGLRLRNLSSLEDIEEEYPKWKNKACREFFEYSGTEFQKVKKSSQNKVKSAIKNGIAMTVSNIFSRLKDTDAQTSKKDMLNRSNKNLNKGIKDTQGEIKNLCNISRKCTNKQFIKACDEAYSKIVAGNNADKAIESSIRKLSQKGIEVVGYTDHTTSMDAAVKRAVPSGVNQTSLKFKMDNCKELGINIVKTSSHGGARPSHQEWQGKLFYLHTPVKGLQNFKKATGYGRVDGLGGANCRHSFYEVTDYEYKNNLVDTEEFDKNRNDDQYELEQKQRYYERQIRSWKKRKNILDECGVDSTKEAKKIREWQDKRSQFIKESNIQFKKEHGIDNVLKKVYPREKVINKNTSQMYRPIIHSKDETQFRYSRDIDLKAKRVTSYGDEVYISNRATVKPRALHKIVNNNNKARELYGITRKPKIIIFDPLEYDRAYGKYDAVHNVVYYSSHAYKKSVIEETEVFLHEMCHMKQAQNYIEKFGEITAENYTDYIDFVCAQAKKFIDKKGIKEYNVIEISEYARANYLSGRFDEVEAEYMALVKNKKGMK